MPWQVPLLVLGGAGVFLALPGRGRALNLLGLALLVVGIAALLGVLAPFVPPQDPRGWFLALALVAVWSAVCVVTHRKPVYNALYFVMVVVAVTGLLVLMQAEFLAAALLIIYAGAILVTYVFVIMLAQQSGGSPDEARTHGPFLGVLTGFVLLGAISLRLFAPSAAAHLNPMRPDGSSGLLPGTTDAIGGLLMTHYAVALEVAAILLLAAMVGAVAIAQRKTLTTTEIEEA